MSERDRVLVEAYWRLRDHAAELRDTDWYRRVAALRDRGGGHYPMLARIESRCKGIEDGARDLAELLGVPEHEIERPPVCICPDYPEGKGVDWDCPACCEPFTSGEGRPDRRFRGHVDADARMRVHVPRYVAEKEAER